MDITLQEAVNEMIDSLYEEAEHQDVDTLEIEKIFKKGNVNELDELFQDGGEARCEHFTDHSIEYALQFGELESPEFDEARWEAIQKAMKEFGEDQK